MRVLVTGIRGFVGGHLARYLLEHQPDIDIHGTVFSKPAHAEGYTAHQVDLRQPDAVREIIEAVQPQQVYHLAAQAFVPRSFSDPWETLENNIRAQLNVTLACLELDTMPRMLAVSSAEVYGVVSPDQIPMTEQLPPQPTSPYSVSKVTQEMLALQYAESHNLPIMCARPFNHFGPGQNQRFVAPDFALQIARIEAGLQPPRIEVGNLSARRDFTDVRDIVRAYHLILERGEPGVIYNVASGEAQSIQHLLDTLISFVNNDIEVVIDQNRLRPVHIPVLLGDAARLREQTGWQPDYTFEQSLLDVLNDARERVRTGQAEQTTDTI